MKGWHRFHGTMQKNSHLIHGLVRLYLWLQCVQQKQQVVSVAEIIKRVDAILHGI
jgi:hypothetical protein